MQYLKKYNIFSNRLNNLIYKFYKQLSFNNINYYGKQNKLIKTKFTSFQELLDNKLKVRLYDNLKQINSRHKVFL